MTTTNGESLDDNSFTTQTLVEYLRDLKYWTKHNLLLQILFFC